MSAASLLAYCRAGFERECAQEITALALEAEVRARGAIPAPIAIVDGRLRAGLAPEEI